MKLPGFSEELAAIVRPMRPILLLCLLVIGAVAGLTIRELFLTKFRAQVSLPFSGDINTFREAEPLFTSVEELRRFGRNRHLLDDPEFIKIERQYLRNLTEPVKIEHVFRISRRDVRDIPDVFTKDILAKQVTLAGQTNVVSVQSDVQVSATASSRESADKLAAMTLDFFRESVVKMQLRLALQNWITGAQGELASIRERIGSQRAQITAIEQRLQGMEALKDKYTDVKENSPFASSPMQVQVTGTKNLSPLQQIIGLEADRVEAAGMVQAAENSRVRYERFAQIGQTFAPRLNAGEAAIPLAREILAEVSVSNATDALKDDPRGKSVQIEIANALATVQIGGILHRYADAKSDLDKPNVKPDGPGRTVATLAGLLVGAGVWFLALNFWPRRARRADQV